jgi:hypothetical protein
MEMLDKVKETTMVRTAPGAIRVLLIGMITVTLTGCGTKFAEVKQVGETGVVVTGADVRMGYTHSAHYDDKTRRVKAQRIFCAEPSPDVAKAVQNAFGLGTGARGTHPSGVGGELNVDLSSSQAQALAQLGERMATIQLLRDGLYRACEAYANGAFSEVTYAVLLSRYDDSMITLLFGELAAGNFGRSLVGLGGSAVGASASSRPSPAKLMEAGLKLNKAATELQAKREELAKARETGEAAKVAELMAAINKAEEEEQKETDAVREEASTYARADAAFREGSGLDRQPTPEMADLLSKMMRSYLYDVNTDALAVACVVALASASTNETTLLTNWCNQGALTEILKVQNEVLKKKVDESARYEQRRSPIVAPSK